MGMDAARRRERDLMRGWRECFRNHGSPMDHATPTNDWLAPTGPTARARRRRQVTREWPPGATRAGLRAVGGRCGES